MIYGIESTTDLRHPETRVQKITSRKALRRWLEKPSELAWAGAARSDIPACQQNFHHRLHSAYEMPKGWRPPSKTQLQEKMLESARAGRYRNTVDFLADEIRRAGQELGLDDL